MNSVLHAANNTAGCRFDTQLCRGVLGWSLAIVVLFVGRALGDPPQEPENYPRHSNFESPGPVAEGAFYPFAQEPYYASENEFVRPVEGNVLVRWWNNRFKPRMQFTHWGYPETTSPNYCMTMAFRHTSKSVFRPASCRPVKRRY